MVNSVTTSWIDLEDRGFYFFKLSARLS